MDYTVEIDEEATEKEGGLGIYYSVIRYWDDNLIGFVIEQKIPILDEEGNVIEERSIFLPENDLEKEPCNDIEDAIAMVIKAHRRRGGK